MKKDSRLGQFVYWTPRILAIIFTVILSMFALDVFKEGYNFWQTIGALLIHLIPTFIIILVIAAAWKDELAGGALFLLLGLIYIIMIMDRGNVHWLTYVVLVGPVFLTGALFILNKRLQN